MLRQDRSRLLPVVCAALAVAALADLQAAPARNFLWKATNRQNTVYLVGSVHMLTKDYYPLSPAVESAFKDSNLLVEETDLGELMGPAAQLQLLTRGMLPAGQSLDAVVSPATFAAVRTRLADLGMPLEPLKKFKPWALGLLLLGLEWQKAGFDAELGLDKHFYDRAQAERKPVQGLETVEFQISRFDEMTMEEQDRMLSSTLKDLETTMASVTVLADAWKAGDAPAVERIVLKELKAEPRIYQRLLVERNRNWLPAIEALFTRTGHAFVVVGAAHLVGPDGLLAMLTAKGYAIEQL